jgi:hypothetical protein
MRDKNSLKVTLDKTERVCYPSVSKTKKRGDAMRYSQVKRAIKQSDKDTVRDILSKYGEDVLTSALDLDIPPDRIDEAYIGAYKDDEDFAQTMAEETGDIDFRSLPWPLTCIDWEFAAKEVMYDYAASDGHYFRNI